VAAAEPPDDSGFPIKEAPTVRRSGPLRTAAFIVGIIAAGAAIGLALRSQRQSDSDAGSGSDVSAMPERMQNPARSGAEAPEKVPAAKAAAATRATEPAPAPSVAAATDAPDATVGTPDAATSPARSAAAAAPRKIPAVATRRSTPAMGGFVGRKVTAPPSDAKKPVPKRRKANPGRELPDKLLF
jgi:uncharacterized membrane protein